MGIGIGLELKRKLLNLCMENPDLPILACVNSDVYGDDYGAWIGEVFSCDVEEYIQSQDGEVFFRHDANDPETEKDITEDNIKALWTYNPNPLIDWDEVSDSDLIKEYKAIKWKKAIFVYVSEYVEDY